MQQFTEFQQGTAKKSAFNLNFLPRVERRSYPMQICSRNYNTKGWGKKEKEEKQSVYQSKLKGVWFFFKQI